MSTGDTPGLRAERSPFSWLAFSVLGLVWGTSWVAADTLVESIPPLRAAALRFLLAALLCLPVILWKRRRLLRGRALWVTLLLSVTMVALPSVLLGWVQPQLPSATVAVLFAVMPLLLTFLTPGAPRAAMQASIVAIGTMAFTLSASFSMMQLGASLVVLAVVASLAVSSFVVRRELRRESPLVVTALLLGSASLLLLLASVLLEHGQASQWSRDAILSLAFLALLAGAPAYAAYLWLLQRMEVYQAATVQWLQPLVAIVEGALLLRIRPSFTMIAGSLMTLVCLVIVMRVHPEDDDTVSLLGN